MANIVIYDNDGEVKEVLKSVDTVKYTGRNDVVINPPDWLLALPTKNLIVDNGTLREKSQDEKTAWNNARQAEIDQKQIDDINNMKITNLELVTTVQEIAEEQFVALFNLIKSKHPEITTEYTPIGLAGIIKRIKDNRGIS